MILACALLALAPPVYSEDDAVALAIERAPELEVQTLDLEVARAARAGSLNLQNPSLRLRHNRLSRFVDPGEDGVLDGFQAHLRWQPPRLENFGARQSRDDARVDFAEVRLEEQKAIIERRARRLIVEVDATRQRLALARESVELAERVRDLSSKKLEARLATRLEDGLARLDLLEAITDRAELETRERTLKRALSSLLALESDVRIIPNERCAPPSEFPSVLIERAKKRSFALRERAARLAEIDAELSRTTLRNVPWLDFLQIGWIAGDRNDAPEIGFRFGVDLPLFNFRSAEFQELKGRRARTEARLVEEERDLERRLKTALAELDAQHELVALYDKAQGEVLKVATEDTDRALEQGQGSALELALVRARLLRGKRAQLAAHLRCQMAALDVLYLVGK